MAGAHHHQPPQHDSYDIVIVGGAIMGASTAWFLTQDPGFNGRVLVVERDTTYAQASTTHTNSCIRQQFSTQLNVRISQYGADYIHNLRDRLGNDDRVPHLSIQSFGYMYLADTDTFADTLRRNAKLQQSAGAATRLMAPDEIAAAYPFYALDGIKLGSINRVDEGYFDGATMFDWWRRKSREAGVEYVHNEVVAMSLNASGTNVDSITLASGEKIGCGNVVNASGPRAARTASMAGIDLPVEPRKRYTWIFKADKPLDRALPLTIDPSGVHVREVGGGTYMAGGHADIDIAADYDDFAMDFTLWEDKIWPAIATRIPQFEAIKVQNEWVGHYAYCTFDQNAVIGPHPKVRNFHFLNGFSGHGLQQSPAMGRGLAELLLHGTYRSLDLSDFHFDRIAAGSPIVERAVI